MKSLNPKLKQEAQETIRLIDDTLNQMSLSIQAFPPLAIILFPFWLILILAKSWLKWFIKNTNWNES